MQIVVGKDSSVIILSKGTTLLVENFYIFNKDFQSQKLRSRTGIKVNLRKNTISFADSSVIDLEDYLNTSDGFVLFRATFPYVLDVQFSEHLT